MGKPGFVDGRHYTTYAEEVRRLKRMCDLDRAEALLLRLVQATDAEARANRWGVAPWYYEQLAIIYAKEKELANELAILERYERQAKSPGARPAKIAQRRPYCEPGPAVAATLAGRFSGPRLLAATETQVPLSGKGEMVL